MQTEVAPAKVRLSNELGHVCDQVKNFVSNCMSLGASEDIEVWFIPSNQAGYSLCVLQSFSLIEEARYYIANETAKYNGALEMVRVTTTRQRVV